ncbi:MAG: archaeosortase/exosortase family protein [Desulfobacteraceae bacterium]|nr:archaeosortase/exosortase family protein [Desulfobacteraceae bacterium]MBC2757941.1 archaeosortase/exosortase family protein [Desulfobacteraceae bacterium]
MSKIKTFRKEIRFFIFFILLFFLFQTLHYIVRPYISPFVVHTLTTSGSSKLINIIMPKENTSSQKEYLSSGHFKLKIARGCEGIEGVIILIAAILAFPAGIKSKLFGIIGGIFVLYILNLFRIAGLYYTLKYKPALFDMMHVYVGQTLIILIAFLYFIAWLNIQMNINGKYIQTN